MFPIKLDWPFEGRPHLQIHPRKSCWFPAGFNSCLANHQQKMVYKESMTFIHLYIFIHTLEIHPVWVQFRFSRLVCNAANINMFRSCSRFTVVHLLYRQPVIFPVAIVCCFNFVLDHPGESSKLAMLWYEIDRNGKKKSSSPSSPAVVFPFEVMGHVFLGCTWC